MRTFFLIALCAATGFVVAGCPNQGGATAGAGSAITGSVAPTGASGRSTTGNATNPNAIRFQLARAIPLASGSTGATGASGASGSATQPPTFELIFNATNVTNTLNDVCQTQTDSNNHDPSKTCKCQYTWAEQNLADQSVINRSALTVPTQITSFDVLCPAPNIYYDEISDNTVIKITLVPDVAAGNNSGFTVNTVNFTKLPITSSGDFRDAEGHYYRNIYHYSCYDKFQKSLSIHHDQGNAGTNPITNQPASALKANVFVAGGGTTITSYSGQSYYFDFYERSTELGMTNLGNANFTCPLVNINGNPSNYPLDSNFALGVNATTDFPMAVYARTALSLNTNGGANTADIVGYAAKPAADGSCPTIADSTGRLRRTFRLRQYSAFYPIRFNADASVADTSQPINTIYILDRPVDKLGQDPLRPITRLGPKPCPFSFRTAQFGQKCMSDASLTGWNIDGTQIDGNPSCPIYPPVKNDSPYLKPDGTLVIRPYKAFVPHYIENTAFRACTFQSSSPIDPEIVLSHDDGVWPTTTGPNDFYCTKNYAPSGAVIPPPGGDPFDKQPGDCDTAATASAIKTDRTYACLRAYDATNSILNTPAAGCCQVCSGPDCSSKTGATSNRGQGRNAVFSPPRNDNSGVAHNPPSAAKQLPRSTPNDPSGNGCFDPYED